MGEPSTIGRNPTRRTKLMFAVAGGLAALAMAAVLLCLFLGIRSGQDLVAYHGMASRGFHPIWRDLAWRRVRKGNDLAETVRKHPPTSREDFGPYTVLTYSRSKGSFNTLRIAAANGILIDARIADCVWKHVFFESPDRQRAFSEAWSLQRSRRLIEDDAWRIHSAIVAGQDVFVSERIERRDLPGEGQNQEMIRQLEEVYGKDYANMMFTNYELTVEVSKVLHGDLKAGTMLTFPSEKLDGCDPGEPPAVFLHVEDARTINPDSERGELYTTVSAKALEWYQSLTPDQIEDFEARYRSGLVPVEPGN